MKQTIKTAAIALMAFSIASPAFAGDYNSGIVTKTPSEGYTDVEFGSGWYLRGDLGYAFTGHTSANYSRTTAGGQVDGSVDSPITLGLGFGYTFNNHLRADFTVDSVVGGQWSGGSSGCGADGLGVAYTGDCSSDDSGNFDALSGTLNGYVELGEFHGFMPYVGAGLGLARVRWTDNGSNLTCTLDPGETCDIGVHSGGATAETFTSTESYSSEESVSFVYALMAGFGYRIDENWIADVNYRYTNISGDATLSTTGGNTASFEDIELHEVRAGLRYELW